MRIAHFSDLHVRNLKYHKEYKLVFESFYEDLRKVKPDFIVCAGDVAHTKSVLSPEYFSVVTDFFNNLAVIAPLVVIAGNHDGSLKNSSRLDAISPIIKALNNDRITYLKNSCEYKLSDDVCLNVLSIFDVDTWQLPSQPDIVNIAMYHGVVNGSETDVGWKTSDKHGIESSFFGSFDYTFLGDIHKQQFLSPKVAYAGSLIQQNFGENEEKGYLLWDIYGKNEYTVEFRQLENPSPFITMELSEEGMLPEMDLKVGAHIRVVTNHSISLEKTKMVLDLVKLRYSPSTLSFINRSVSREARQGVLRGILQGEDLRELSVQERLIREYLKSYENERELMDVVLSLNEKYDNALRGNASIARNVNWTVKRVEWDNLFNYGSGNFINYEDINGIIGIFGKSYSGKTSVIDALLFGLFNTTSKNERKNYNVVNQNKQSAKVQVWFEANGVDYRIERSVEKYVKKLKGVETNEAKTEVSFWEISPDGTEVSKNGDTRSDTEKNIRSVIGTIDDLILTTLSTQHGALAYLFDGPTKRKEILARFTNLEEFGQKFELAKEDSALIKADLRRVEAYDFDEMLTTLNARISVNEIALERNEKKHSELSVEIEDVRTKIEECKEKLASIPKEVKEIGSIEERLREMEERFKGLSRETGEHKERAVELNVFVEKTQGILKNFDIQKYQNDREIAVQLESNIAELIREVDEKKRSADNNQKKVALLSEVPCGESYPMCRFVKDAFAAKRENVMLLERIAEREALLKTKEGKRNTLNIKEMELVLQNYAKLTENLSSFKEEVEQKERLIGVNEELLNALSVSIRELTEQRDKCLHDKQILENSREWTLQLQKMSNALNSMLKEKELLESERLRLHKAQGALEGELQLTNERKEEKTRLRQEFSAYELYMNCMHSSGISYMIIKEMLPLLNEEIAKVLANIVNFEIYFENNEDRLDISIKHPKHELRPLEMGSGAEKAIAAMAIRIALTKIGSLPVSDMFILDEPATGIDEERMEGFIRVLDMLKTQFKTVVLISHLDNLKDSADSTISIEKIEGYASVRF